MNENLLCAKIGALRRASGMTQEQLAARLGVTYQAVSKWENAQSCPDIMLLPVLAETFQVSIDELFGRERPAEAAPETNTEAPGIRYIYDALPWQDDRDLHAVLFRGHELLDEQPLSPDGTQPSQRVTLSCAEGVDGDVHSGFSVSVTGQVGGNVDAGFDVSCGDVGGDVDAGGSVKCGGGIGGGVDAGGSVECGGGIGGDVDAGCSVKCGGDIDGDVDAGCDVSCGSVGGDVDAGGSVECGSVGGDVDAGRNVNCGSVGGDVDAGGCVELSLEHGGEDSGHGTGYGHSYTVRGGSGKNAAIHVEDLDAMQELTGEAKKVCQMSRDFVDTISRRLNDKHTE